jgi:beta-glucosidase
MPASRDVTDAEIAAAARAGELEEAVVDRAAERVLTLLARALPAVRAGGSVARRRPPRPRPGSRCGVGGAAEEHADRRPGELARTTALLPLDSAGTRTVAVIGEFARTPRSQGAGSSQVTPTRLNDAWSVIRDIVGDQAALAAGFGVDDEPVDGAALHAEGDRHAPLRSQSGGGLRRRGERCRAGGNR